MPHPEGFSRASIPGNSRNGIFLSSGIEWHLSPEESLLLHSENTVIPAQAIINSPQGINNKIGLLFGTPLYDLRESRMSADRSRLTKF